VFSAFGVFVVLKRVVHPQHRASERRRAGRLALCLPLRANWRVRRAFVTGAVVFLLTLRRTAAPGPKEVVLGNRIPLASIASVIWWPRAASGLRGDQAMLYGDSSSQPRATRWVLLLYGGSRRWPSCCCFCGSVALRVSDARRACSWASAAGLG
jgi:hypothetical protein